MATDAEGRVMFANKVALSLLRSPEATSEAGRSRRCFGTSMDPVRISRDEVSALFEQYFDLMVRSE